MSAITYEMIEGFSKAFNSDPKNLVGMRAAMKSGLSDAAENQREQIDNPMTFSIEIETGKITNQKQSGRCWLFAALNCMRFEVMKKLNLDTFELSQNYQMFYDKLENILTDLKKMGLGGLECVYPEHTDEQYRNDQQNLTAIQSMRTPTPHTKNIRYRTEAAG